MNLIGKPDEQEVGVRSENRVFALRLKVIEILDRYSRVRRQMHIFRRWKMFLITPN